MSEPAVLELGPRDMLVVAGLPGAGKTTMLRHAAPGLPVLDSDEVRARLGAVVPSVPYRWYRPLVHACHRLRIAGRAFAADGPIVVHEPSTRASTRALLALIGAATGRSVRLLFLDVTAEQALAGQHSRGRLVRPRSFARHVRRVGKWREELLAGRVPPGWREVRVIDRHQAERTRLVAGELSGSRRD
ncbi:AAA family ATPase [Amycolatopsis sp. NEAU-NG30]|uniref:AAA family ATPase n=1 Tax=Amycolatopsis melonis TaxID=3156488 RepID=A0ABV0LIB0_9PSEU